MTLLSHVSKKSLQESFFCPFFLTSRSTQLINATVTAIRSQDGMNFLWMSAGSELEPGPRWSGQESGQKLLLRPGVPLMSRQVQATARAAGRGGFTGG
jgi:hypothetical protein